MLALRHLLLYHTRICSNVSLYLKRTVVRNKLDILDYNHILRDLVHLNCICFSMHFKRSNWNSFTMNCRKFYSDNIWCSIWENFFFERKKKLSLNLEISSFWMLAMITRKFSVVKWSVGVWPFVFLHMNFMYSLSNCSCIVRFGFFLTNKCFSD